MTIPTPVLIGGGLCLLVVGAAAGCAALAYYFGKGWMR